LNRFLSSIQDVCNALVNLEFAMTSTGWRAELSHSSIDDHCCRNSFLYLPKILATLLFEASCTPQCFGFRIIKVG
jgi:hypothetical protein